jgi:peptidyl-prolyl cis-trans isomerase A (cyclophilin A)
MEGEGAPNDRCWDRSARTRRLLGHRGAAGPGGSGRRQDHGHDEDLELDADKAPITVENFLAYVDDGFYDGTVFHRVIPNFMVQGGGFDESMSQKPTRPPIENEAQNGLLNQTGTLAMARTSDPNSATAQFFINLVDNDFLNHGSRDFGYAVFARVVGGMDVVQQIAGVPTGNRGGHQNVPLDPVSIVSITRD